MSSFVSATAIQRKGIADVLSIYSEPGTELFQLTQQSLNFIDDRKYLEAFFADFLEPTDVRNRVLRNIDVPAAAHVDESDGDESIASIGSFCIDQIYRERRLSHNIEQPNCTDSNDILNTLMKQEKVFNECSNDCMRQFKNKYSATDFAQFRLTFSARSQAERRFFMEGMLCFEFYFVLVTRIALLLSTFLDDNDLFTSIFESRTQAFELKRINTSRRNTIYMIFRRKVCRECFMALFGVTKNFLLPLLCRLRTYGMRAPMLYEHRGNHQNPSYEALSAQYGYSK